MRLSTSAKLRDKIRLAFRVPLRISERRLLMMTGDTAAIVVAIVIALRIWAATADEPFTLEFVLWRCIWFVILPTLWFVFASANDYFNLRVTSRAWVSVRTLAQILIQLLIFYLFFFFTLPGKLPRLFILDYIALSLVLIGVWRLWQPFLLGWPGFRRRALIVGGRQAAEILHEAVLREASSDYEIVGLVNSQEDGADQQTSTLKIVGTGKQLPDLVRQYDIVELINAYASELPGDVFQGMMSCSELGVNVVAMSLLYEEITGRVPIEHVGQQYWVVLPNGPSVSSRTYLLVKRLLDVIFAVVGLFMLALLLPVLALLVRWDSPGSIFYPQERVGYRGRKFTLYKLRSMVADAEQLSGPQWAANDDPRMTRGGKLLRRTRLDELPQLLNVLTGEMSLVGPRPERAMFVEQLTTQIPFYRARLTVKPGITGWAQVRYPYGRSTEDALHKLQYDLYYIRHQSMILDVQIIVRTLGKMLWPRET